MMKNLVLLLLLLFQVQSFACDCLWINDDRTRIERNFSYSEVVFISDATFNQPDSSFVNLHVVEVLKGKIEVDENLISSVISRNNCDQTIFREGKWLIYGHFENDTLRLNTCSLSNSFEYPNLPHRSAPPMPDFDDNDEIIVKKKPDSKKETFNYFSAENIEKVRTKGRKLLDEELKYLRKLKAKANKK